MKSENVSFKGFIVIDIDNTIIDTAIRKQKLLERILGQKIEIKKIREDFNLKSIIGEDTDVANNFFKELDTREAIIDNKTKSYENASSVIKNLRNQGFEIYFLTARINSARDVTIKELQENYIDCPSDNLLMLSDKGEKDILTFKKNSLNIIGQKGPIVTFVGDRPADILAAQELDIPSILYTSTITVEEIKCIYNNIKCVIKQCATWIEIENAINEFQRGTDKIQELRTIFSNRYADWLKDIDNKIRTLVIIASIIATLVGLELITSHMIVFPNQILFLVLFLSILSILYSLRGLASRHTSGDLASCTIGSRLKQVISILIGYPIKWYYVKGDPIDEHYTFISSSIESQKTAHLRFFFNKYKTNNQEILLNRILLELRATNYSKVYSERCANRMLTWSIYILLIWFVIIFINNII